MTMKWRSLKQLEKWEVEKNEKSFHALDFPFSKVFFSFHFLRRRDWNLGKSFFFIHHRTLINVLTTLLIFFQSFLSESSSTLPFLSPAKKATTNTQKKLYRLFCLFSRVGFFNFCLNDSLNMCVYTSPSTKHTAFILQNNSIGKKQTI